MARSRVKCPCCERLQTVKVYRLESHKNVYPIEWAYQPAAKVCKFSGQPFIFVRGEKKDGTSAVMELAPDKDLSVWQRRIDAGEFKAEPAFISEHSQRVARGADVAFDYLSGIARDIARTEPRLPMVKKYIHAFSS